MKLNGKVLAAMGSSNGPDEATPEESSFEADNSAAHSSSSLDRDSEKEDQSKYT